MKPQILQLNPILIPAANDELASRYVVHKYFEIADQAGWLREHGASIQAVITGGHTGISRAMLEQLPALKVVAVNGVGTDAVDLAYCRERGLAVTATLGALTEDVADLAIGLLIAACHEAGLATLVHTPNPMKFLNRICNRPETEKPFLILVAGHPADGTMVPKHALIKKSLAEIAGFL